jgi:3-oxoadipate enol-lactonase
MCRFSAQSQPQWARQIAVVPTPLGVDAIIDVTLSGWFTAAFFATRAADVARAARTLGSTSVDGYLGAVSAMSKADLTTRLPSLGCPVQVLLGESDRITPAASAERILMQVPQARLWTIAGAAHLSNVEQPDDFNAALREFLASGI